MLNEMRTDDCFLVLERCRLLEILIRVFVVE